MDSFGIELTIIIGLSLINGIFSMAELAVVSANRGRLAAMAGNGNKGASIALTLGDNPAQFLATVQIGITLIGIFAGVFGGATLAEDLTQSLVALGMRYNLAYPLAFAFVVACISYLTLVFGELVPKQIAISHPERVAALLSRPLLWLSRLGAPIVWILENSSKVVAKLLPFTIGERSEVSEEDIQHMVTQGAQAGEIENSEKEMVLRIFRLDDRPISAFMTVRRDVVWLDTNTSFDKNWETALASPHSFFPVADGTLDRARGVVSLKDLWLVKATGGKTTIQDVTRPALAVLRSLKALDVLEEFKRKRRQLALVVDEHGGVDGVVTTHDLLEAVVGDLADFEGEEHSIVQRSDGTYLVDATIDIQEILLRFEKEPNKGNGADEYHSVGGVVFGELKGIKPSPGTIVEWQGLVFEVVDMDGHRIDKILVSKAVPTNA